MAYIGLQPLSMGEEIRRKMGGTSSWGPQTPAAAATKTAYSPGGESAAYNLSTDTAKSNLAASPYNVQIADLVNAANRAAQQAANLGRIPGAAGLEELSSENIAAGLRGEVDPTTQQMLATSMAQNFGGRGFGVDTPALSAAYYRALGMDIASREAEAQKELTAAYARNPAAPIYGLENLLVKPETYSTTAHQQAVLAEQARQADAELALKYAALGARGGGGGGGGVYRPVASAAEYNSVPKVYGMLGNPEDYTYTPTTGPRVLAPGLTYDMGGTRTNSTATGGYSPTPWDFSTDWETGIPTNTYV